MSQSSRGNSLAQALEPKNLRATLGILAVFAAGIALTRLTIVEFGFPLPKDPLREKVATTLIQTFFTVALPYAAAWFFWRMSPADLGINAKNLGRATLWGIGLYAIALVAFVYCSNDPIILKHPAKFLQKPENLALLATQMCLHAAATDLATRGFILLTLNRYSHVAFAIFMQNAVWFYGHYYEVRLLSGCLGFFVASALFVALGVLGDMVALRTRNVVGLAVAHILLNLGMIAYIRQM